MQIVAKVFLRNVCLFAKVRFLLHAILAAPSHQLRAAILHREHALRPADRAEVASKGEARAVLERPLAWQAAPQAVGQGRAQPAG